MKKRIKKILLHILLPLGCFLTPILFFLSFQPEASAADELSQKLLRFHVVANSDSQEDQAVKLQVKENILSLLSPSLAYAETKEEAKEIISANMEAITETAQNTLRENGFSYSAAASLCWCDFPVKTYGDLTFPAGTYEALRIVLGEGAGKNWWCVMYPPLCFVDVSFGTVPDQSKAALSHLLTDDTYDSLNSRETSPVRFRFKLFSFLNRFFWPDS